MTEADAEEAVVLKVDDMVNGGAAAEPPTSQRRDSNDGSLEGSNSSVLSALTETEHAEALEEKALCHKIPPINWVETLSSPVLSPEFSPSLPASSFGLGLKLAVKRASDLTKSGRRCANIVLSMANLYEAAAGSLNAAASSIPPGKLLCLQEWSLQWSREMQKLGETCKTSARPLNAYLVVHGDATDGISRRTQQARRACVEARTRELGELEKQSSTAAVQSKMPLVPDLSSGKNPTTSSINGGVGSGSEHPPRLNPSSSEKHVVQQCQRLEQVALEQLRLQEADRAAIFGASLKKILEATKECVEELSLPKGEFLESDVETVVSERRVKKHNFAKKLLKAGNIDIDNINNVSGAMDADTLGLPEDVGKLRDQVKVKIMSRASRLQLIRVLAAFLESVATTSAKLGTGLRQLLEETSSHQSNGSVSPNPTAIVNTTVAFSEYESPAARKLWDEIISAVDAESKASLAFAASLRNLRRDKLDKVLMYGDKTIKSTIESDDFLWKQLCDAARHQARSEVKYQQTAAQTAKLRERVKSVDSDPGRKKEASKVSQHVSKSIANMFSILPDGGDQAMKIFAPSARATIAAHSLEEADTRETKGRQQLDAAVDAASRSLESYRSSASALVKQYDDDEKATWDDVRAVIETFSREVEATRSARLQGLVALVEYRQEFSYLEEFRTEVQKKIESFAVESSALDESCELAPEDPGGDGNSADSLKEDKPEGSNSNVDVGVENDDTLPENVTEREEDGELLQNEPTCPSSPQKSESSMHGVLRRHASGLVDTYPVRSSQLSQSFQLNVETEVFLTYFWQDPVDRDAVPPVLHSFACSFRDSSHRLPFQYGRLFVTSSRIIFNSWTGRKLNISWTDVKDIELVQSDDALLITSKKSENEEVYSILGGFDDRNQVLERINKVREDAVRYSKQKIEIQSPPPGLQSAAVSEVPPDTTLKKMEHVLTRHLKAISIQRFYEIAWSEGNNTNEKPLYGPWLGRVCFDIDVGEWQFQSVTGPWCGETYEQMRFIRFKVKRKTHLYIGPPIANVQQTHYCRREGNDKCVLGMTIEFEGIPYSDTFAVEVRWVACREGSNDIRVDVGVFVDFRKNTLLKAKIRSGTIEETTPVHKSLFEAIKEACVAAGGQDVDEAEEEEEVVKESLALPEAANPVISMIANNPTICVYCCTLLVLYLLWRSLFRQGGVVVVPAPPSQDLVHLGRRIDELEVEIKAIQSTLNEVVALLKSQQQSNFNE